MKLTIIVPAFNEEACLAPTLRSIRSAAEELRGETGVEVDIIVVDSAGEDGTAAVARELGATVLHEPVPATARARGAERAGPGATCSSSSMPTWSCLRRFSSRYAKRCGTRRASEAAWTSTTGLS